MFINLPQLRYTLKSLRRSEIGRAELSLHALCGEEWEDKHDDPIFVPQSIWLPPIYCVWWMPTLSSKTIHNTYLQAVIVRQNVNGRYDMKVITWDWVTECCLQNVNKMSIGNISWVIFNVISLSWKSSERERGETANASWYSFETWMEFIISSLASLSMYIWLTIWHEWWMARERQERHTRELER